MLKTILCLSGLTLLSLMQASGQVHVGASTSMYLRANTTLAADSLILVPSTDLTLSNLSISHTSTPVTGPNGASILKVYQLSAPVNFQGHVGMYYADAQLNGNVAALLALAYKDEHTGNWVTTTGSAVNTTTRFVSNTLAAPVSLSSFTATSSSTALPVSLIDFTAYAEGKDARLNWELMTHDQHAVCYVQRSADGAHFTSLGKVMLREGRHTYKLYDRKPNTGTNFYRLQWEEQGKEKFSAARTVTFSETSPVLTIYPVPVTGQLHLKLSDNPANGSYITLASVDGKVMLHKEVIHPTMSLDMQSFAAGTYLLAYYDGSAFSYYKIEKPR